MRAPETRFTRAADGVRIAYQVFGRGGVDLLFVPGWVSHVELNWEEPSFASFLERLGDFARVVVVDKRGTGCSDRVERVPDLETRVDDVRAVLDAEGFGRVVLLGESSGAAMAALFAATYPERARALVMTNASARTRWATDYPWGMSDEQFTRELQATRDGWESGDFVRGVVAPIVAPGRLDDEAFLDRLVAYHRAACSRDDAIALNEMWWDIDYRAVLPSISRPTLLLSAHDALDETTYLAERIPGAQMRLVPPGGEMWQEGRRAITDAVCEFVSAVMDEEADFDRVLATVLFTDIVESTAHAATMGDRRWEAIRQEHDEIVSSHLARYRGKAIKTMGDGFLATFDGPARAIRCSLALVEAVHRLGIEIRAGLHTGEIERTEDDIHGIAVAIAARVASVASGSEVLVSQTVKDLVAGSGLLFESAGIHALKGIPDALSLYRPAEGRPGAGPAGGAR